MQPNVTTATLVYTHAQNLPVQPSHLCKHELGNFQTSTLDSQLRVVENMQHQQSVQSMQRTWEHLLGQSNSGIDSFQQLSSENYAELQNADSVPFRRLPSANSVISHAEPVAGISNQTARQARKGALQSVELKAVRFICLFRGLGEDGALKMGTVSVVPVPPKGAIRVREKLYEYAEEQALWPLTASVLDPVSARVAVCVRILLYVCANVFLTRH